MIQIRHLMVPDWNTVWVNGKRVSSNHEINASRVFKHLATSEEVEGEVTYEKTEFYGDLYDDETPDYRANTLSEDDWKYWVEHG